jgi:Raf kinase inhibitor-like YbhB/YbcL family protein
MKTLLLPLVIFTFCMNSNSSLGVVSSAFEDEKDIPKKYTCESDNVNPPLTITNVPEGAKSLALIVYDPDAPDGNFIHWVMWNIPVKGAINENSGPGVQGLNGKMEFGYTGPCPPSGTHHYHFKAYALDTELDIAQKSGAKELEKAMSGHILATGELVGLYKKSTSK